MQNPLLAINSRLPLLWPVKGTIPPSVFDRKYFLTLQICEEDVVKMQKCYAFDADLYFILILLSFEKIQWLNF